MKRARRSLWCRESPRGGQSMLREIRRWLSPERGSEDPAPTFNPRTGDNRTWFHEYDVLVTPLSRMSAVGEIPRRRRLGRKYWANPIAIDPAAAAVTIR